LAFCPAIWQYFKGSKPPAAGTTEAHLLSWLRGFDQAMALATSTNDERKLAKDQFNLVRGLLCVFVADRATARSRACSVQTPSDPCVDPNLDGRWTGRSTTSQPVEEGYSCSSLGLPGV
jgi:hypothetical protein